MGFKSSEELVDELQRRLTNLSESHAVAALNRAQRWCIRTGTFSFLAAGPVELTITQGTLPQQAATATLTELADLGKAKMMLNSDGTPIMHVPWSEFWSSYNYNLPTSTSYDTYTFKSSLQGQANQEHTLYFFPNQSGTAYLHYHTMAADMTGLSNSYSVLPPEFDDLLIDLAEADERRIYDIGDHWPQLLARSQEQIKLLLDSYRSQTQQPSSLSDSQAKQTEVAQIGRT